LTFENLNARFFPSGEFLGAHTYPQCDTFPLSSCMTCLRLHT